MSTRLDELIFQLNEASAASHSPVTWWHFMILESRTESSSSTFPGAWFRPGRGLPFRCLPPSLCPGSDSLNPPYMITVPLLYALQSRIPNKNTYKNCNLKEQISSPQHRIFIDGLSAVYTPYIKGNSPTTLIN